MAFFRGGAEVSKTKGEQNITDEGENASHHCRHGQRKNRMGTYCTGVQGSASSTEVEEEVAGLGGGVAAFMSCKHRSDARVGTALGRWRPARGRGKTAATATGLRGRVVWLLRRGIARGGIPRRRARRAGRVSLPALVVLRVGIVLRRNAATVLVARRVGAVLHLLFLHLRRDLRADHVRGVGRQPKLLGGLLGNLARQLWFDLAGLAEQRGQAAAAAGSARASRPIVRHGALGLPRPVLLGYQQTKSMPLPFLKVARYEADGKL